MPTVKFIESNPEPTLIAYRADLKKFREFYSKKEAANFFKCKPVSVIKPSYGYDCNHLTGKNINQKWFIFNSGLKKKYVSEYLNENKTDVLSFY
ncbi:hypothetical protein EP331_00335 [bacterium]|nr:MAG: hypothetical protein EP331_00335 [bacterium]